MSAGGLRDAAAAAMKARDYGRAATLYGQLVEADPSAAAHDGLGLALHHQGRRAEAADAYRAALALDAKLPETWWRLGLLEAEAGRLAEAEAAYDAALNLNPNYQAARANRGEVRLKRGEPAAALADLDRALAAAPQVAGLAFNAAQAHMALGHWRQGLTLFEARRAVKPAIGRLIDGSTPEWRGGPLAGVRLRVHADPGYGYGDIIQFSRFARLAAERGAKVTLRAPARAVRLLSGLHPDVTVVDETSPPARADAQALLLSLPLALGGEPSAWGPQEPYLVAEPEHRARWAERIGPQGLKVGLAWRGDPNTWNDKMRSIPLTALAELGGVPGVRFISLQKGAAEHDADPAGLTVERLGPDFAEGVDGFLDTAAAIMALDLVITCCTSVAHLAGALGKPVWLLLSHACCWRWGRESWETFWYPSMRLFRQTTLGDWSRPVAEARTALTDLAG